jgi:phage-related protein (TIGR01555 family)
MFKWLKGKTEVQQEPIKPKARKSLFSTHAFDILDPDAKRFKVADTFAALQKQQPALHGDYAMDDSSNGVANFKMYANGMNSVSDAVIGWYASQGFIGAQLCGILAQNWLVNKACAMPADDAVRKGYNVVTVDGDELDPEAVKIIKAYDKAYKLNFNMREFIRKGRIFGIRVAMFKVISTDKDYYEKPFNIDGVTAGSYKGIVQVDPYWTAPMLDGASASQPDTLHFYEPTWWIINGKKVHRSHLIIFRHAEPVDVLKPQYIYGGVPLTQQIMERVYAAERTSNEAPQLAMSKRTTIWLTDMEAVMSDTNAAIGRLQQWAAYRDNYGVKLGDKEGDEFQQFDTSLADFDSLIMTQYQLVAAIAGVPATKLLGTSPKGFNATGEYEEASYHEMLESIQSNDLTPFAERHHALVIKSFVEPQLKMKIDCETTLNWLPLDTPTAEELAATNLAKAQAGQVLIGSGAISSEDERQRVATDKQSGYNEIGILEESSPEGEEEAEEDFESVQDGDFADPEDGEGPVGKMLQVTQDKDPCWEGYEQYGMKDKDGKQVPNCVAQDDAKFREEDHPRAKNGQFGSGGASAAPESKESKKKEVNNEAAGSAEKSPESAQKELPLEEKKGSAQAKATFQKVKELPNGGYVDQHGFEHSPGLSQHERDIEDNFYSEILNNKQKLLADYKSTFGNTIDPDLVKKLDPEFAKDPSLAAAVHEPSSLLSKEIWKTALADKKAAGDKSPVLFTAGGSGSGKSEAMGLAKEILGAPEDSLTFDSVLGNFDKSVAKINEALKGQDGPVDIIYTNAPLELAVKLNLQRGRTIRLDTQLNAHFQASENIKKLAEHYKNDLRVNITVVNNSGDPPDLAEGKLSDVPTYSDPKAVKEKMVNYAKSAVANGQIVGHDRKPLKDAKRKLEMLLA